jgi:hypothetical protein
MRKAAAVSRGGLALDFEFPSAGLDHVKLLDELA